MFIYLISNLRRILPTCIAIIAWGYGITSDTVVEWLQTKFQYKQLFAIGTTIILILANVVYFLFLHICDREKKLSEEPTKTEQSLQPLPTSQFTLKNGIYFDKNNNAYCPICQKPITQSSPNFGYDEHAYYCLNCNKRIPIHSKRKTDFPMPFSL